MTQRDLTYLAVRRQLEGMRASSYEVGILERASGKMQPRTWTPEAVLKAIAWLKKENTHGKDIYIRPEGSQGLILLDDITHGTVERLKGEGIAPAVVVETSPMNYQAWICLSDTPIPEDLATFLAKKLARLYGADPNSADWRHYGRLAGFTNCKPEYRTQHRPYVKAHACNGTIAAMAENFILEARKEFEAIQEGKKQKHLSLDALMASNEGTSPDGADPVQFYNRSLDALRREYGSDLDESRADWMIVKDMLLKRFSEEQIAYALYRCSPQLETRKKGHIEDYISRTIRNAQADPDIIDRLRQKAFRW